jgi:hypothetical protein
MALDIGSTIFLTKGGLRLQIKKPADKAAG